MDPTTLRHVLQAMREEQSIHMHPQLVYLEATHLTLIQQQLVVDYMYAGVM